MGQLIKEEKIGFSLTLPDEWNHKKLQTGYVFGHPSVKGIMLLLYHYNNSLAEMKEDMYAGFYDNSGFNLQVDGGIKEINEGMILAEYTGVANGEAAQGYGVGLLSPYGRGVLIAIFTTPAQFSEKYMDMVEDMAMEVQFEEPVLATPDEEWTKVLFGQVIENQKEGVSKVKFYFHGEDTFTAYTKGRKPRDASQSDANSKGQWEVLYVMEQPILKLTYFDGSERQYTLHVEGDDIFLNNEKWELSDESAL